jgi:parvulin-like peptidyl-prolyl isomerase
MRVWKALTFCCLVAVLTGICRAQEGEAKLVDEVIARVNSAVILRSTFLRAQQDLLDDLKGRGVQGPELEKQFNDLKPVILDQLIDTELVLQRAKELSIDVEAQVNEQLLRVMKENNLQSLEDLTQKMREVGVDIDEVRRSLRTRFYFDQVRNREVLSKVFFGLTEKEKRDYYDKHVDLFAVPGEVTLSRIFLATGKDPKETEARAKSLADQARSGATDFATLAQRYSESEERAKGGSIGALKVPDLNADVRAAVATAKVGMVTDPIKLDNGYAIFRVDGRKEPVTKPFEDPEIQRDVSERLTLEKGAAQFDAYLEKLRGDAFIEIDPKYRLEGSKIKSAEIKHSPYLEEKDRKQQKKEEKKKAKDSEKTAAAPKP